MQAGIPPDFGFFLSEQKLLPQLFIHPSAWADQKSECPEVLSGKFYFFRRLVYKPLKNAPEDSGAEIIGSAINSREVIITIQTPYMFLQLLILFQMTSGQILCRI
jgi:hypothetical protein